MTEHLSPLSSLSSVALSTFASLNKVIGAKQSRKAIQDGRALRVCLACDADPALTHPIAMACDAAGIPVESSHTMAELGRACQIAVGAAVVAFLK